MNIRALPISLKRFSLVLLPALLAEGAAAQETYRFHSDYSGVPSGTEQQEELGAPTVVSPPVVVGPVYACDADPATVDRPVIGFDGLLPGADVTVYVNGFYRSSVEVASDGGRHLELEPPLYEGDVLQALQTAVLSGTKVTSSLSEPVYVAAELERIQQPFISPTPLYRCAELMASRRHAAGASVAYVDDATGNTLAETRTTGYVAQAWLRRPLERAQQVVAKAQLCRATSESPIEVVQEAPSSLPVPVVEPVYEGADQIYLRDLVQGSTIQVWRRDAQGIDHPYGTWGTAFTAGAIPMTDAVQAGDQLWAQAELCGVTSSSSVVEVGLCHDLPAPEIRAPGIGQRVIEVIRSYPGALISIWDANRQNIGYGGGSRIGLVRAIRSDDVLTVVQELGDCVAPTTFAIASTCKAPVVVADPASDGPYEAGHRLYQGGTIVLEGESVAEMKGHVFYPVDRLGDELPASHGGPFPVVFMQHGNGMEYEGDGYAPLGEALARRGFIFISMHMVGQGASSTGEVLQHIRERTEVMLTTVRSWDRGDIGAGEPLDDWSRFRLFMDFDRTALAGHSRGGQAAVHAAMELSMSPGDVAVSAVLSVTPTDYARSSAGESTDKVVLEDIPLLVIVGARDGDTYGAHHQFNVDIDKGSGLRVYDRAAFPGGVGFKTQLYVHGANHNDFNTRSVADDFTALWGASHHDPKIPRLDPAEQAAALASFGAAFLELTLNGREEYRPVFSGDGILDNTPWRMVYASYEEAGHVPVSTFDETPPVGSIGAATVEHGFADFRVHSLREEAFDDPLRSHYNGSFLHDTSGLVGRWEQRGSWWQQEVLAANARVPLDRFRYLSFRAAWVHHDGELLPMPPAIEPAMFVEVALSDGQQTSQLVSTEGFAALPRRFEFPSWPKTVMRTVRMPLSCFVTGEGELDISETTAIELLSPDTHESSALVIDDVAFTN